MAPLYWNYPHVPGARYPTLPEQLLGTKRLYPEEDLPGCNAIKKNQFLH